MKIEYDENCVEIVVDISVYICVAYLVVEICVEYVWNMCGNSCRTSSVSLFL